jgi:aminoglycoside phosphotransferase (APT) family kinase protein
VASDLLYKTLVAGKYSGHLRKDDPLHAYLTQQVLPPMGPVAQPADFRVFCLKETKVYRYEESHNRTQVVGKFFVNGNRHETLAVDRMRQEFENLHVLRGYGLCGYPHHVVRPLGTNVSLNGMLVEEYCGGAPLSTFIDAAIHQGQQPQLFAKLTALAYFLATLHNRTANGHNVDFSQDCAYLDRLVRNLASKHAISAADADELYWLRDLWRDKPRMWEDRQVFVHGDATPSNFMFGEGLSVMAIDLERMKRADRVFDLGRIAGELQHFFLQATGNKYAAEPFIGHFLWEYACHFPDRGRTFQSITARTPFQMGLTLLRIARNSWVSSHHRQRLIAEAKIILRTA